MNDIHPEVDDLDPPVEPPPLARAFLVQLESDQQVLIAAEAARLRTILALCYASSAVDDGDYTQACEQLTYYGAQGTPPVAEFLSLEVGALLAVSPGESAALIGRVLSCAHRLPVLWDAVQTGAVWWTRAVDVVDATADLSVDVARKVDAQITPRLATLSRGRARRLLRGLIALADPTVTRTAETEARARRGVSFFAGAGATAHIMGQLDLADAVALDTTLDRLARTLADLGDVDPVEVRRATALGVLADPARALEILTTGVDRRPARTTQVVLHLSADTFGDPAHIGRVEGHGPITRESWVELLRHDHVVVRPVVDLNAIPPVDSYEIPDRIRQAVTYRSPADMFPYGAQPSAGLDLDHTIPFDHRVRPSGQTRVDNLAPLTRKAHRAKTSRHWSVTQDENGWLEWTSPAGHHYAVGPYGTYREARRPATTAA